jgi:hypothetical protein
MQNPTFLGQAALARRWGFSERTLERWRCLGEGPSFLKLGGHVLYRLSDVQEYEAERLRTRTSVPDRTPTW